MSQIAKTIVSAAQALPEGGLLSPKEFLHLASRAAVDQTFARLASAGTLLRVGRGLYAAPVHGKFGARPPSTHAVIEAIASAGGELVVPSGATEANALGLTTQTPVREIFLTSGRARKLRLGNRNVELKHGSRSQLALGNRPAGMAIRALSWLGPDQATAAVKVLRKNLATEEWNALRAARAVLPDWMAKAVSEAGESG